MSIYGGTEAGCAMAMAEVGEWKLTIGSNSVL
jgi:hypothetical protein